MFCYLFVRIKKINGLNKLIPSGRVLPESLEKSDDQKIVLNVLLFLHFYLNQVQHQQQFFETIPVRYVRNRKM